MSLETKPRTKQSETNIYAKSYRYLTNIHKKPLAL